MGGFGTREDLLAGYEAEAGRRVDPDTLRWWEAMGTLKWGVICMLQARAHLDGQSRSVELAAIGRRVCETEHDLFLLLPGGRPDSPSPRRPPRGPARQAHGSGAERGGAEPWRGRGREHRRSGAISLSVAVNVLAIIERELELGPAMAAAHRARLDRLGFERRGARRGHP